MSKTEPFVYLASQSPRRAQLLEQIGVKHRPLLPHEDEDAEALESPVSGELPDAYVQRVTLAKLAAAQRRLRRFGLPAAPILCADTTVALGRRVLGKPEDADDARASLRAVSGKSHRVLTAVAVCRGRQRWTALSISRVRMAHLPPELIQTYVNSGEPFGKAGSYAVQGALAGWIACITGSHSGIMGLPLHETTQLLLQAGVELGLTR
jgi:septum formation protein